jgi:hypothetical protein
MWHKTGRDIRRTERLLRVCRYVCLSSGLYRVSATPFLMGCAERTRCHETSWPLISYTNWNRIILENVHSAQLRNFQDFVGSKGSLPCSQKPTTGPCPEAR